MVFHTEYHKCDVIPSQDFLLLMNLFTCVVNVTLAMLQEEMNLNTAKRSSFLKLFVV